MQSKPILASWSSDNRDDGPTRVDHARLILAYRHARDAHFGAELFGEPAWEIQLAIIGYGKESMGLTADNISQHINCSPCALKRWLAIMIERDMLKCISVESEDYFSLTENSMSALQSISV